jgi:Ser/Thr protein kinase RdoA (MazF antagonist)
MNTVKGHVPTGKLTEIADVYGVGLSSMGRAEGGYRNVSYSFTGSNGEQYNFILYKHEPGIIDLIRRTNALGKICSESGLPVRAPVDERILRVGQRYGSLYRYLDGETIPWEAYTKRHIKLLGLGLAQFHDAAMHYSGALPDVEDVYLAIFARMHAYFSDSNVVNALQDKLCLGVALSDVYTFLHAAKQLPGRTVLHMDMVRSNVLFREKRSEDVLCIDDLALSGILDLEKAARGHVLFDIARTLAFLLVDCDKPADKIYKYFLDSGYRKRGQQDLQPVIVAEADMLEQLVTLFLAYDFYKFLRQNPYESLPENHHFVRTVAILKARKVVQ